MLGVQYLSIILAGGFFFSCHYEQEGALIPGVSRLQHFHDGRKAQQHIETCWKQLESVSEKPAAQEKPAPVF